MDDISACPVCDQEFWNENSLIDHVVAVHFQPWPVIVSGTPSSSKFCHCWCGEAFMMGPIHTSNYTIQEHLLDRDLREHYLACHLGVE